MRSTWSPGLGSTLRVQRIVSPAPTVPMSIMSPRLKRPTTSSARSGAGDGLADGFGAAEGFGAADGFGPAVIPIQVNHGLGVDVFLTRTCLPEDLEGHVRRLLEGNVVSPSQPSALESPSTWSIDCATTSTVDSK